MGDPSSRWSERELSEAVQIESNTIKLTAAVQKFFERATTYAVSKMPLPSLVCSEIQVLNNIDWFRDLKLLDFLRTTGVHFRVNHMLARDRHGPSSSCIVLV